MQTKTLTPGIDLRGCERDEELAGILMAISIVSKRLAKKLLVLQRQDEAKGKGGTSNGEDH